MRLLPKRPSEWSNDRLKSSFRTYFVSGTIAYFVASFCWVGFAWILISQVSSPAQRPHYGFYYVILLFVGTLAGKHAMQVDAIREFLTRFRADLGESRFDKFMPPQSRLDLLAGKAFVLIASLVGVAAVGWLIFLLLRYLLMAPVP